MLRVLLSITLCFSLLCCGQSKSQVQNRTAQITVGGSCEGCGMVNNYRVPFEKLSWTDTLPDFNEGGPRLVISGTVYKADGKTPAKDVVLYVYHTDQTGHYTNRNNESGYAGSNGYIKGWIKTNAKGQYKFYTLKPVPYPGGRIPAHIHPVIKEPGKSEYWIDEYLFDDDPLLTTEERSKQEGRGGSGILRLEKKGGMLYGRRDIILGRNIPDYPASEKKSTHQGLMTIGLFF